MSLRLSVPAVAAAVVLLCLVPAVWSQPKPAAEGAPQAARAVSLVLQKIFVENPSVIKAADPEAWSGSEAPRSWRVQRSGDAETRFDVTYLVRGKALCIWRVNLISRAVQPTDCQLENLDSPPA